MKRTLVFAAVSVLWVLLPDICLAAGAGDSDIIARVVQQFAQKSEQFTTIAKKYALQLFGLCATLEIAYLGIKAALGTAEIGETIKNFVMALLAAGLFLAVINNYEAWCRALIVGLQSVAGEMGNVNNQSDSPFKLGLELASQYVDSISVLNPGSAFLLALAALIILVVFCLITAQVIFVKCEAYIAMAAACILVGFGASSFFRDYAINVLKYVVSVAFKLMVLQMVIGVGFQFIQEAAAKDIDISSALVTVGIAVVLLALVKAIPDTVAGIINGSHVGAGGLMDSARSVASTALAAGVGAYAGSRNASLAAQAARAEGATGFTGTMAGTASHLYRGWREAAHNKDDRQSTIGSALRQQVAAAQMPKEQ